jgi:hypothetical protein
MVRVEVDLVEVQTMLAAQDLQDRPFLILPPRVFAVKDPKSHKAGLGGVMRPAATTCCSGQTQKSTGQLGVPRSRPRGRPRTARSESVRDACAKEDSGHRSETHAAAAEPWLPTGGDAFTGVDSGLTGQGGECRLLWKGCHGDVIRGPPWIGRWSSRRTRLSM